MRPLLLAGILTLCQTSFAQAPEETQPDEQAPAETDTVPEPQPAPETEPPVEPEPAPLPAPEPPPQPEPEPPPARTPAPAPSVPPDEGVDSRILFGGIALGVGGAAIVAGAVVGFVAAAKYADLDCPNDVCPPDELQDSQDYNDLRIPSGATIFAGSLVAFVGAVFLINGMTDDDEAIALEVSPQSLVIRGRF